MEIPETKPTESSEVNQIHSREPLFGTLFFFFGLLAILVIVALVIWGGYRGFRLSQEQAMLPSISSLAVQEEEKDEAPIPQKEPQPVTEAQPTPSNEQVLSKAQNTDIKVLNGGAAKGSASVAADVLKKAGYTKVATGNTVGNYTGVVVYYASGLEKEADMVKSGLLKAYPKIEAKATLPENKETAVAPLTVILGK